MNNNLLRAAPQVFVEQVAGGGSHTCALTNLGGVRCWGNNNNGQLGDGTTFDRSIPVDVLGLSSGVIAIASGGNHNCVLMKNGAVRCWGSNTFGQLGDGTTKDRTIAVEVLGLAGKATKIVAGGFHNCALIDTGAVKCWGVNSSGQLGDGSRIPRSIAVDVVGLSGSIIAVATGFSHTCALISTGRLQCWGENVSGQLGDGTTTGRFTPVDVSGLSGGVVAVATGINHTCAVTNIGSVRCWGLNFFGQLGDGTTTSRLAPVEVSTLDSGVTAISAGGSHSCALVGADTKCWGANQLGQLGNPNGTEALTPIDVQGLNASAIAISAGFNHNCALTDTGTVKCWGNNGSGQLGEGTVSNQVTPAEVSSLIVKPVAIAAGGGHTCLRSGNKIKCWGSNNNGQLGDGTITDQFAPVDASNNIDFISIATGGNHTCAVTDNGSVDCWGSNRFGQLGDNTMLDRLLAGNLIDLKSIVAAVAAGANHSCALTTIGSVLCWGSNSGGALGDGTTNDRAAPVEVSDLGASITAISAGGNHSCALSRKGNVSCWGSNRGGQLGDGTNSDRLTPTNVFDLGNDIVAITTGESHTCALDAKGVMKCWGNNSEGQLGDGTNIDRLTPIDVAGIDARIIAIAAGGNHSCALTDVGAVKCWGNNAFGQVGDGTFLNRLMPVDVAGMSSETIAIATGGNHTCGLGKEYGVSCWGSNHSGQIGDGTNANRFSPTALPAMTQRIEFDLAMTQSPYAATITANASANSGLPVAFDSLTTSTCIVAGSSLVTIIGQAGELCLIRAQQTGNGSYLSALAEIQTIRIVPSTQTIIFAALPNRAIANGEFLITAVGGDSGLPITFVSQTPEICATGGENGTTVSLLAAGVCTIRASQLGTNNFTQASDVDQSFSVTRETDEDSNTDWWRWRGGSGCTIRPNAGFDWAFAILLVMCLGLRLRR